MDEFKVSATETVGGYRCGNAGCSKSGAMQCGACKKARYSSKECQKADWKCHKLRCGTDRGVAIFSGPDAMQRIFGAMSGGHTGAWHAGISRSRVIERLIMSWRLHVDDTHRFRGDLIGVYARQFDSLEDDAEDDVQGEDETLDEFRDYIKQAKDKGVLPPWWDNAADEKLMEKAKVEVQFALEKSDVVEKFGYSSNEHMVLRSMSAAIVGSENVGTGF